MSLQELKAQIIEDVQAVDDEQALREVLDIIHCFPPFDLNNGEALLTPVQKRTLGLRAAEIAKGNFLTQEEVQERRTHFWSRHAR